MTANTRELLDDARFRLLFGGSVVSAISNGMIPIVFTVETLRVSTSPWALSAVLISLWVGRFGVIPLSGSLAAAHHPLKVMVGADLLRITAQAGLIGVIALAGNSVAAMAGSALVYGIGSGIYIPARVTVVPQLVGSPVLDKANALLSAAQDVSLIAGPALGVLAIHLIGFSGVLALDCATFALNILALWWLIKMCGGRLGRRADPRPTGGGASISAGTIRTAWRAAKSDAFLGASLLFWTIASMLIGMIAVYAPARIVGEFGNATMWAAISTVMAISSLAGSITAVIGSRMAYGFGVAAVAVLLLAQLAVVAGGFTPQMKYMAYLVFGAGALMTTWSGIQWTTKMQRRLPRVELGRFSAVESALTSISVPVGMALGPILKLSVGPWVLAVAGTLLLGAGAKVIRTPGRETEYATT